MRVTTAVFMLKPPCKDETETVSAQERVTTADSESESRSFVSLYSGEAKARRIDSTSRPD